MRTFALITALAFLAACGKEEAHDHDHDHDHDHGAKEAPAATDTGSSGDAAMTDTSEKAPSGDAEMKTVTLDIEGMS